MIDVHCHFDMFPNPKLIIKECEEKKIVTIGMTNLPSHFQMGIAHTKGYKYVRLALGFHPLFAQQHYHELELFEKNIDRTSYIGEVGLDFSNEGFKSKKLQVESLRHILGLVREKNKLISLHSRRAEKEVFSILQEFRIENAIFHWYSGPINLVNSIVEGGYFFSINSSMIVSSNGKKIISQIPKNRLLTETDGPYAKYLGKPAKPENVKSVLIYLADYYKEPVPVVETLIRNNFSELIKKIRKEITF